MPRGKSSIEDSKSRGESRLPVLADTRLTKALDHVLRQHILLAAVQGPVSPNELSKLLGEGLSQVSYHVNVLHKNCDEMIELVHTEPRRGAVEHYYRASAKTLLPAKAWRRLKKGLRTVVGAGQASDLFNDLTKALEAGKLQGTHDHIARTPLLLDNEGQRNVKAIAERVRREVEDEQVAVARRMRRANGDGGEATAYTFALLAFEAAWQPADLGAPLEQAEGTASEASGDAQNGGGQKKRRRKAKAAAGK
jgi:hypothetical protein